jgi:hypothetical protein
VTDVLETNVICYSTPMSSDLRHRLHTGGAARGREIFKTLLDIINPQIMIVHGSGTVKELSKVLKHPLPSPPTELRATPVETNRGKMSVFIIPSLAPPGCNRWSLWPTNILRMSVGQWQRVLAKHLGPRKLKEAIDDTRRHRTWPEIEAAPGTADSAQPPTRCGIGARDGFKFEQTGPRSSGPAALHLDR